VFTQPSDLPDSQVSELLRSAWSLTVDSIEYAPVGFGSHHWVVSVAGRRWFVTVDSIAIGCEGGIGEHDTFGRLSAALSTARLLRDLGLTFVVAPVATTEGELVVPVDDRYVAALYPHVDGQTYGWGPFVDRVSRVAVLERLVSLHAAPAAARRHALFDDFGIRCRHRLDAALADTSQRWHGGPFADPARRLLARHEESIVERLVGYDRLVSGVADRLERLVVTHGEPHRGNTITTGDGVMLVDWDTALLAPPERDLWWLAREDATVVDDYERQTRTAVDTRALELYRLKWDLTDLAVFTAQLRQPHEDNEDTRTAWDSLSNYLDRSEG
jgi:spectinomycin phosphotransferase